MHITVFLIMTLLSLFLTCPRSITLTWIRIRRQGVGRSCLAMRVCRLFERIEAYRLLFRHMLIHTGIDLEPGRPVVIEVVCREVTVSQLAYPRAALMLDYIFACGKTIDIYPIAGRFSFIPLEVPD